MAAVGRRRTKDRHLPQRVYLRHGAYYFARPSGSWVRLGKDYAEALRALAGLLGASAPVTTLELLAARYDAEELSQRAEKTRRGRRQEFKRVLEVFGEMSPPEIEPHHVWTYWGKRGRTEQARHEIRALSALMTFARRVGALSGANPCFGLQLPQSPPRRRYVTTEEYEAVKALAPPMIRGAMELAVLAGLDQATIRRLERRHVVEDGLRFERGKTGALQLIEWSPELRAAVRRLQGLRPQLRQALVANRRGRPYSADGFQAQWQRVMRRAKARGIAGFHFHDLRAKSASDAATDQEAADRLGHQDPALTRKVYRRRERRAPALRILDKPPKY